MNLRRSRMPIMLPDHARPEYHVGRYRFTSHPTCDRGEFQPLPSRMHRDEQRVVRRFVPLARPKWRHSPMIQRWCILKHVDQNRSCTRAVKQLKMSVPLPFRQQCSILTAVRGGVAIHRWTQYHLNRSRAVLLLVCSVLYFFPRVLFELYYCTLVLYSLMVMSKTNCTLVQYYIERIKFGGYV